MNRFEVDKKDKAFISEMLLEVRYYLYNQEKIGDFIMAFVNEKLTEKDKEFIASFKFHNPIGKLNELAYIPEEWSIDKEHNYYIMFRWAR